MYQCSECKSGSFSLINYNLNLYILLCVCSQISSRKCLRTGWQILRDSRPKPTMWPTPRWSPHEGWCPWWPRWSVVKDHKMEPWGNVFRAKPRVRIPWTCSTPRRSRSTGLRTTWTPSTPRWRRLTRPWLGWRNGAACSSVPGTGQYEEKVRI